MATRDNIDKTTWKTSHDSEYHFLSFGTDDLFEDLQRHLFELIYKHKSKKKKSMIIVNYTLKSVKKWKMPKRYKNKAILMMNEANSNDINTRYTTQPW